MESALTVRENGGDETYNRSEKIEFQKLCANDYFQLIKFKVCARNWQSISSTDRFIKLAVPEITDGIMKKGSVIMYLHEARKHVSLPFTYYQETRAITFQPSYEQGIAYINVLGNFILSVSSDYHFKILIINQMGLAHYKGLNLSNYTTFESILNEANNC